MQGGFHFSEYEVNTMQKPKMVIFDAGKTLLNYLDVDMLRGIKAYTKYLTANPKNLTVEEIRKEDNAVFGEFEHCRKNLFEVPAHTVLGLMFERLGLKFSISLREIERLIWENDANIVPVEGAKELLDYLNSAGIRTAVISNLDFSGYLLKERLNRVYPNNRFEFVITSSDYGIRKPHRYLFEAGIAASGLQPEEIWYVGDKVKVDVVGSQNCGMLPVLYKSEYNAYGDTPTDVLTVEHYAQLIDLLNS